MAHYLTIFLFFVIYLIMFSFMTSISLWQNTTTVKCINSQPKCF